jgi:hypothetical protein
VVVEVVLGDCTPFYLLVSHLVLAHRFFQFCVFLLGKASPCLFDVVAEDIKISFSAGVLVSQVEQMAVGGVGFVAVELLTYGYPVVFVVALVNDAFEQRVFHQGPFYFLCETSQIPCVSIPALTRCLAHKAVGYFDPRYYIFAVTSTR